MFCIEEKNVFIYAFYIDKSRAVKCILPLTPTNQIDGRIPHDSEAVALSPGFATPPCFCDAS